MDRGSVGLRRDPAAARHLERVRLEVAVRAEPIGELAEVDLVRVELGPVHAGVDGLAADRNAAPAAHPGPVEHDRVERRERRHAVRPGELGDRTHHRDRADRVDGVDAARLDLVAERVGDEAVPPVAAVVRAGDDPAGAPKLVLEDDPFLRPSADDADHLDAEGREPQRDRVDDGRPDAAADTDRPPVVEQLGRPAQRAGHVGDRVARAQSDEILGALAHSLDHERDRAARRVRVGDRERDPLGARGAVDDDELAGAADLRDPRRLDDQAGHVRRDLGRFKDGVHRDSRAGWACSIPSCTGRGNLMHAQRCMDQGAESHIAAAMGRVGTMPPRAGARTMAAGAGERPIRGA